MPARTGSVRSCLRSSRVLFQTLGLRSSLLPRCGRGRKFGQYFIIRERRRHGKFLHTLYLHAVIVVVMIDGRAESRLGCEFGRFAHFPADINDVQHCEMPEEDEDEDAGPELRVHLALRVFAPASMSFQKSSFVLSCSSSASGSFERKRKSRSVFLCSTRWTVMPSAVRSK